MSAAVATGRARASRGLAPVVDVAALGWLAWAGVAFLALQTVASWWVPVCVLVAVLVVWWHPGRERGPVWDTPSWCSPPCWSPGGPSSPWRSDRRPAATWSGCCRSGRPALARRSAGWSRRDDWPVVSASPRQALAHLALVALVLRCVSGERLARLADVTLGRAARFVHPACFAAEELARAERARPALAAHGLGGVTSSVPEAVASAAERADEWGRGGLPDEPARLTRVRVLVVLAIVLTATTGAVGSHRDRGGGVLAGRPRDRGDGGRPRSCPARRGAVGRPRARRLRCPHRGPGAQRGRPDAVRAQPADAAGGHDGGARRHPRRAATMSVSINELAVWLPGRGIAAGPFSFDVQGLTVVTGRSGTGGSVLASALGGTLPRGALVHGSWSADEVTVHHVGAFRLDPPLEMTVAEALGGEDRVTAQLWASVTGCHDLRTSLRELDPAVCSVVPAVRGILQSQRSRDPRRAGPPGPRPAAGRPEPRPARRARAGAATLRRPRGRRLLGRARPGDRRTRGRPGRGAAG